MVLPMATCLHKRSPREVADNQKIQGASWGSRRLDDRRNAPDLERLRRMVAGAHLNRLLDTTAPASAIVDPTRGPRPRGRLDRLPTGNKQDGTRHPLPDRPRCGDSDSQSAAVGR